MKKIVLILIACTNILCSCVSTQPKSINANQVIEVPEQMVSTSSELPFWSFLTDFEIQTLMDIPKAKKGDPDALLALGVMASGNIRDLRSFQKIQKGIHKFIKKIKPEIEQERKFWKKGYILHQAIHNNYYLTSRNGQSIGYTVNQTRLTEIFTSKKYNCVSSAMLYAIIARYFNIHVNGVVLPTHAFVQIESPKGKIIEIETTSTDGYDWVHDKKYYRKQAGQWFRNRGLRPSTFQDYKTRKIIPPYLLIAANMNNQHTKPKRMNFKDRFRLAEAHALTDPTDRAAQYNRLAGYNNMFNQLDQKGDHTTLVRMFHKTDKLISELRKYWKEDAEILNMISWLEYEYAHALHKTGKHKKALEKQEAGIMKLGPEIKDRKILIENQMSLINNYMIVLTRQKQFTETEKLFKKYINHCKNVAWCKNSQGWFYNDWAIDYWNKGDWSKTTEKLGLQINLAKDTKLKKRILQNLDGAYLNWSISYQNQGNWIKAAKILEHGLTKYPDMQRCRKTLKKLKTRHRL